MWNPGETLKLSYQPATQHRFIGFVSRSIKNERERGASRFVPLESTWNYWYDPTPWKFEYQWTPSSRVMVNAMFGDSSYLAQWRAQDGADVPGNPMTSDIITGFTTGPAATARNPNKNHQINASMNYYPARSVMGRHELKVGYQQYISVYGVSYTDLESGNYTRLLNNGAAYQIRTEDRAVDADSKLNNPNLFLSDTWRVGRRVTANLGVRFEHHDLFSRGGVKQASEFGTPATYGEMDILTWNGIAPRVGASWDILGSGRTVLKGQWGRYLHMAAANFGSSFNPATVTVTTLQVARPQQQPPLRAGRGESRSERPGLRRARAALERVGHQHDAAADRQPGPGTGAHRRNVADARAGAREQHVVPRAAGLQEAWPATYGNVKMLRPYSAWNIPITRRDPGPDGTTGNADDGGLVTFCDYDPRYKGAAFEPTSPVNRDSDHDDTYKGFELTLTKRQSNGWMALGSFQMVKNHVWTGPVGDAVEPERRVLPARRDLGLERQGDGQLSRAVRHQRERAVQLPGRRAAAADVSVPQRAERDDRHPSARGARRAARSRPARGEPQGHAADSAGRREAAVALVRRLQPVQREHRDDGPLRVELHVRRDQRDPPAARRARRRGVHVLTQGRPGGRLDEASRTAGCVT